MNLVLFLLVNVFICVFCGELNDNEQREIETFLNPGCELNYPLCDNLTLVYVKASAKNDILHYLWDFTGVPGIMLAKTSKNSNLSIHWDKLMAGDIGAVNFTIPPSYVFGMVINKIYLFDDTKNTGLISDSTDIVTLDYQEFKWERSNLTEYPKRVELIMNAEHLNGSFSIKLAAFTSANHGDDLPHLLHSAQSMQSDFVINRMNVSSYKFSSPRFAIQLLLFSSEKEETGNFTINNRRNLDDEFTPGIFEVIDVVSPLSRTSGDGGFIQYRPVCYLNSFRSVSDSTELKQSAMTKSPIKEFKNSLPFLFFGFGLEAQLAQGLNISFGIPGDGFYSKNKYISFSLLSGIGKPPVEPLSAFVIGFATIGLGVPLAVMITGGVYVTINRLRSNSN
ncbi:unnamed protein product [Diamesa serratosioi]